MLFSRTDVADAIDRDFEPVWVSVRPVPTVKIDFGEGHVVTRTLHGNVATLILSPAGQVMDAVPGILTPRVYLEQLAAARDLTHHLAAAPSQAATLFRSHHADLASARPSVRAANAFDPRFLSKSAIERPIERLLSPAAPIDPAVEDDAIPPADLSTWKRLQADTQASVNELKRQIHAKLAAVGPVPPKHLVKWLYREVLHADLDDPYLGLGPALFDTYPFQQEESR